MIKTTCSFNTVTWILLLSCVGLCHGRRTFSKSGGGDVGTQAGASAAVGHRGVEALMIEGLVAAVFSPFDDDFELDVSVVSCQASYLNSTGVSWIFISGTTGESVSMSYSERIKLMNAWLDIAPTYNFNLIVMVGANVCVFSF